MHIARLLGIWAHPDDEAYLSAGLMARVVRGGGRVSVVTATRGEAGGATGRVRERELRASLAVSGVRALHLLGYPDGGCAEAPHERGVEDMMRAISAARPDVIVTFGPDGVTGHPDHIAVSQWVTDAWCRLGRPADLLYAAHTPQFFETFRAVHDEFAVFADRDAGPTPPAEVVLQVDLDDHELSMKRAALGAHATQTNALAAAMGEDTYREWIRVERFRRPAEVGASIC